MSLSSQSPWKRRTGSIQLQFAHICLWLLYFSSIFSKCCAWAPPKWITTPPPLPHSPLPSLCLWIPCLETHSLNRIRHTLPPYPLQFHFESNSEQQRNYQKPFFHNVNCILNLPAGWGSPRVEENKQIFLITHLKMWKKRNKKSAPLPTRKKNPWISWDCCRICAASVWVWMFVELTLAAGHKAW